MYYATAFSLLSPCTRYHARLLIIATPTTHPMTTPAIPSFNRPSLPFPLLLSLLPTAPRPRSHGPYHPYHAPYDHTPGPRDVGLVTFIPRETPLRCSELCRPLSIVVEIFKPI